MKTRMPSRLLCLCLCALLCLLSAAATAAPGDTVLYPQRSYYDDMEALEEGETEEPSDYLSSVAIMPGGVYAIVNEQQVTRWQPGDEAPKTLFELENSMGYYAYYQNEDEDPLPAEDRAAIEASIHKLIAGDDGLYAINLATMKLARVSDTGYEFMDVTLDMPPMEVQNSEWHALREMYNAFVFEDALFLMLGSDQENDWEARALYRVPLSGEPHQVYDLPRLATVASYKDGMLLAGVQTATNYSAGLDLVELDIKTGQQGKTLKTEVISRGYDPSGFAYAPEENAVYFLDQSQVQRLDLATGEVKGLTFLAASSYGGSDTRVGVLEDGYFALSQYRGVFIRNTDPAYAVERALRIAGGWEDAAYNKFTKEHPEIPVLLLETDYWDADQIAQAIQTGETEVDIFTFHSFGDLPTLLNKGYAADLSASEVLSQDVAAMYPQIQEALRDDQGVLRAYPMSFYYQPMLVNMTLFEEYFPGEDLPETWAEFLRLYLNFTQDQPDDVAFLDYYVERDSLVNSLLNQFAGMYEQDGQEADFEHPALREALDLVAQLPVNEQIDRWSEMTGDELAQLNDYYSRSNIFSTEVQLFENLDQRAERDRTVTVSPSGGMMISESWDSSAEPDPDKAKTEYRLMTTPVFEPGQDPMVQGQMSVMVVNPESSNLDFAITYLEALSGSLENQTRYALHPDLSEPVRSQYYEYNKRNRQKSIDELEEDLAGMEVEDRKESEDFLAMLKREMEQSEANDWDISARALEEYREIAPYITLRQGGLYNYGGTEGSKQIYSLIEKYTQGQMQLDAFLKELNGKVRMIRREQL